MGLYWDAPYEIVLDLMAHYPNQNIETIGLEQLHQMIITLPNFADDPSAGYPEVLSDILGGWYEEVNL